MVTGAILREVFGEKLLQPHEMGQGWLVSDTVEWVGEASDGYDRSLPPSPEQLQYRIIVKAKATHSARRAHLPSVHY